MGKVPFKPKLCQGSPNFYNGTSSGQSCIFESKQNFMRAIFKIATTFYINSIEELLGCSNVFECNATYTQLLVSNLTMM